MFLSSILGVELVSVAKYHFWGLIPNEIVEIKWGDEISGLRRAVV
jgi:hypothetical protein